MKVIRSTRCSTADATQAKKEILREVLTEYGRVVNHFIGKFWTRRWSKNELLAENIAVPDTWLSARLRKVAAREAIDMVKAARERDGMNAKKPIHHGKRMHVSSTIATLSISRNTKGFDAWLHLASIGRGIRMNLPIRFHRHYHLLNDDPRSHRLESYIITEDTVQLAFSLDVGEPRRDGPVFGLDTGINTLAALSDGTRLGTDIKPMVERVNRCRHGSKGQKRARRALHQRIAEVAKEVTALNPRLIVAEDLTLLSYGRKTHRRVSKNIRRSLGAWAYRDWLNRLSMACETNRVRFEQVPPAHTSQRCHACGHIERGNRKGEEFRCRACGCTDHADVNAARNLLDRFYGYKPNPARAYGPGFKPRAWNKCPYL
ncbi:MAG: transposase [Methanomassiliicoccales archaeon]